MIRYDKGPFNYYVTLEGGRPSVTLCDGGGGGRPSVT